MRSIRPQRLFFWSSEPSSDSAEDLGHGDARLISKLCAVCPERLKPAFSQGGLNTFNAGWEITPVAPDPSPDGEDWLQVNAVSSSIMQHDRLPSDGDATARLQAAVTAASCIEHELAWYFAERDSRLLSRRSDPVGHPCARTFFARRLHRYASSLRYAYGLGPDLDAWCLFLRRVLETNVFSKGNWLWRSRFEPSLQVCLLRLEELRRFLDEGDDGSNNQLEQVARIQAAPSKAEVADVVVQRDVHGNMRTVRLQHFAVYRQLWRAEQALPRFVAVSLLRNWIARATLGAACLDVASQLTAHVRAFMRGHVDGGTLAEDAVISTGSAGAFALGRCASLACAASNPSVALLLDVLGPSMAAACVGNLLRRIGGRVWGCRRVRALRCAYATLGLNPAGASTYTARQIESQLAMMLKQRKRDSVQLWAAYTYIQRHHHPGLVDVLEV